MLVSVQWLFVAVGWCLPRDHASLLSVYLWMPLNYFWSLVSSTQAAGEHSFVGPSVHSLPLGVYLGLELQNVKVGMYLTLEKFAKQVPREPVAFYIPTGKIGAFWWLWMSCYHLSFSIFLMESF